jgi:metal-responsive CopG/Arc/MetJ family transcriptional regulator
MPNNRAINKRVFGVSFDRQLLAAVDRQCKVQGITRVEFLRLASEAQLLAMSKKSTSTKK